MSASPGSRLDSGLDLRLDARLAAAAQLIRAERHADIGSDHARLPVALLRQGRVQQCVVVERTAGPLAVAREALRAAGLLHRAGLRLGDGFMPLAAGEVHSASLTGMGARTIQGILQRAPDLPPGLVLQANDAPQLLRAWALTNGYHLRAELLAPGFWTYTVLRLEWGRGEPDRAYHGLDRELALRWGPHALRRRDPLLREQLERQEARLSQAAPHGRPEVLRELQLARRALDRFRD